MQIQNPIMNNSSFDNLVILPFDCGGNLINKLRKKLINNIIELDRYLNILETEFKLKFENIEFIKTFSWSNKDNHLNYAVDKNALFKNSVAHVKFQENLYFAILTNGVGLFIFHDKNNQFIKELSHNDPIYVKSHVAKANAIKTLLENIDDDKGLYVKEREIIQKVRDICWKTYYIAFNPEKELLPRSKATHIVYDKKGFSFINHIVFTNEFATNLELKYIQNCHETKMNELSTSKTFLKKIIEVYNEFTNGSNNEKTDLFIGNNAYYYNDQQLIIKSKERNINLETIFSTGELYYAIAAQVIALSELFIVKNVYQNISKEANISLKRQKNIETTIEYFRSSLDNSVSIETNNIYKKLLQKAIDNLDLKQYYNSLLVEVSSIKRITKTSVSKQDKLANVYISISLSVLIAISFSLFIYQIIQNKINATTDWWTIPLLLFISILGIIALIVFIFKHKR